MAVPGAALSPLLATLSNLKSRLGLFVHLGVFAASELLLSRPDRPSPRSRRRVRSAPGRWRSTSGRLPPGLALPGILAGSCRTDREVPYPGTLGLLTIVVGLLVIAVSPQIIIKMGEVR